LVATIVAAFLSVLAAMAAAAAAASFLGAAAMALAASFCFCKAATAGVGAEGARGLSGGLQDAHASALHQSSRSHLLRPRRLLQSVTQTLFSTAEYVIQRVRGCRARQRNSYVAYIE
jgi:hypothetical protein